MAVKYRRGWEGWWRPHCCLRCIAAVSATPHHGKILQFAKGQMSNLFGNKDCKFALFFLGGWKKALQKESTKWGGRVELEGQSPAFLGNQDGLRTKVLLRTSVIGLKQRCSECVPVCWGIMISAEKKGKAGRRKEEGWGLFINTSLKRLDKTAPSQRHRLFVLNNMGNSART